MARYCTNCGHELPEGKSVCPECGFPAAEETPLPQGPEEGMAPPPQAPQPPRIEAEAPKQQPNAAPVYVTAAPPGSPPVSTGGFFGLEFLYKIPLVSFICSIVLSIAPKNKNVRHHAQAKLIWKIVGFVLLVACILLTGAALSRFWDSFKAAYSEATGHAFSFSDLQNMDPSQMEELQSILQQYGIENVEGLEGIEGILEQYGIEDAGKLGEMQGMLEEYGIRDLEDLQGYLRENGAYEGLPAD